MGMDSPCLGQRNRIPSRADQPGKHIPSGASYALAFDVCGGLAKLASPDLPDGPFKEGYIKTGYINDENNRT